MERAACRRGPRLRPASDERWGYWSIPLLDDQGRPTRVVSERGIVDALATLFAQDVFNLPPAPPLGVPHDREGAERDGQAKAPAGRRQRGTGRE
jgi:hypothetical protein